MVIYSIGWERLLTFPPILLEKMFHFSQRSSLKKIYEEDIVKETFQEE